MKKQLPLFFILAITALMGSLHLVGTYFYFYWQLPGYDRIVHTVGGFLAALIVLVIIYFYRMPQVKKSHIIILGLFAALVLGLCWEVFEITSSITSLSDADFYINNGGDVIFDLFGGLLASYYFMHAYGDNIKIA